VTVVPEPSAGWDLRGTWFVVQILGLVPLGVAAVMLIPADAFASTPTISIPAGPFTDGQVIAVSGSGFPPPHQIPTGLQIYECTDTNGQANNLPTDPDQCEGTTVSDSQINTDETGRFSARYPMAVVTLAGGQAIDCDSTHICVLWVGVDFNNAFLSGPHAFSTPFEVQGASTTPSVAVPSATTTSKPSSAAVAGSSPEPGVALPSTAPNTGAAASSGSLAFTGPPDLLPWLVGTGAVMTASGAVGRRRVRVRLP